MLKAIKEIIRLYEDPDPTHQYCSTETCPLCEVFHKEVNSMTSCTGCPLSINGEYLGCTNHKTFIGMSLDLKNGRFNYEAFEKRLEFWKEAYPLLRDNELTDELREQLVEIDKRIARGF